MSKNDVSDLRDTIIPKSDQLNADQLVAGPITITVTDVARGANADQPLTIHYDGEDGRPFKPCKTVRKILLFAWGDDGRQWVGRSMTLFCDPEVKWAGVKVGGIRVSHMSHIQGDIQISLASTRGKKDAHIIRKLVAVKQEIASHTAAYIDILKQSLNLSATHGTDSLRTAWEKLTVEEKNNVGGAVYLDKLKAIAAKSKALPIPEPETGASHDAVADEPAQKPEF